MQVGATLAVVEVEPWVLPAGAGAEVDGEPTAAVDAGVVAADEAGRWGRDGTPFGTMEGTARRSCHNLSLLCFLVGADRIIPDDDITEKL
jgi:hypothetical protein